MELEDLAFLEKCIGESLEKQKQKLNWNIVYRRSIVRGSEVGEKEDLEYKENLLFILKTSTGKRIGGFITNYLIEE